MINELSALRLIGEQFKNVSECVKVGVGDDAAAVNIKPGKLLLATTDCQVEEVHFTKSLISPKALARKAVAVSVSDIGAMGGIPKFILASLGFSKGEDESLIDELIKGFRASEEEFRIRLIGGNLSSSDKLFLDVTVLGEIEPENIVSRSGAAPGDIIFVSGTLGDSALGMSALGNGDESEAGAYLINRHITPRPRLKLGRLVAEKKLATSMIDVSDGLLLDLERITVHQGTGAEIEIGKIPVSRQYKDLVTAYSEERYEYALSGGEDYELIFTTSPRNRREIESVSEMLCLQITEIGHVTKESELRVIDERGDEVSLKRRGFVHFNN